MPSLRIQWIIALSAVALLLSSIPPPPAPGASAPSSPYSISIGVIPPRLPADGGSYSAVVVSLLNYSGSPSIAASNITVFLSSSQVNVGSVEPSVTIEGGATDAVAKFTTTTTPGTTVITATAVGLRSVSAAIETVTPSGYPQVLALYPVPSANLARPNGNGTLIVEVEDQTGLPAKAISDVNVSLSSSNTAVANFAEKRMAIPAGQFMSSASFKTGFVPGITSVTATSSGFASATASISVVGPSPLELKLFAQPGKISTSSQGRLLVRLSDASGNPARAPSDITVAITSSNLTVARADTSVTIGSGEIYASASYYSTSAPGSSTMTASSPGLVSSFVTVETTKPSIAQTLEVSAEPSPVLADGRTYSSVVVFLANKTGYPAFAPPGGVDVTLTSSDLAFGTVTPSVTIPAGSGYAVASFTSTYVIGETQITASAQNLTPAQAVLGTFGPVAIKVVIGGTTPSLPADGGTYAALAVVLEDSQGSPALAPTDVVVGLSSSRTDIASVNSFVTIPAGQTFAVAPVKTSVSPGTANITASAIGYQPSSTTLTTFSPAPSRLALYIAPSKSLLSLGGAGILLSVQLQDSNGNPARARQSTGVTITSSDPSLLNGPLSLTIGLASDHSTTLLTIKGSGTGTLTALSAGLASAEASLSIRPYPLNVTLGSSSATIYSNQTASFTVKVIFNGAGLAGATVSWTTSSGELTPATSTTDSQGQATALLSNAPAGIANVEAVINGSLVGRLNLTSSVIVLQAVAYAPPSLLGKILVYLPVVVVAAILAVALLVSRRFVRRRRKTMAEKEAEEEEMWAGGEPTPTEGAGQGTGEG